MNLNDYFEKYNELKEKDSQYVKIECDQYNLNSYNFPFSTVTYSDITGYNDKKEFKERIEEKIPLGHKKANKNGKETIVHTNKIYLIKTEEKELKNSILIDGFINLGNENSTDLRYVRLYSYYEKDYDKTIYDIIDIECNKNVFYSSRAHQNLGSSTISYEELSNINKNLFNEVMKIFEIEKEKCIDIADENINKKSTGKR